MADSEHFWVAVHTAPVPHLQVPAPPSAQQVVEVLEYVLMQHVPEVYMLALAVPPQVQGVSLVVGLLPAVMAPLQTGKVAW